MFAGAKSCKTMMSFKDVESYDDGIIDADEFVLLFDTNTSKRLEFTYSDYDSFSLDDMDNMLSFFYLNHCTFICIFTIFTLHTAPLKPCLNGTK